MFSTSNDVLNLVLSICLISLTFFLCWAIYYFIASVQRIYRLTKRVEDGVIKAEEILDLAKDKLRNSGVYLTVLTELVKKAMGFIKDKREKRATANKKK